MPRGVRARLGPLLAVALTIVLVAASPALAAPTPAAPPAPAGPSSFGAPSPSTTSTTTSTDGSPSTTSTTAPSTTTRTPAAVRAAPPAASQPRPAPLDGAAAELLGALPPTAGGTGRPAAYPVHVGDLAVFDGSRSTPARGGVPGHPGRDLYTLIWLPDVPGTFPLIVLAHGFNTTPGTYGALASTLASAGYVVAGPSLPGGRADLPGSPTQADIPNQPTDLSFVISALANETASPTSWLSGRIDVGHIGAIGHSDGGAVVAALALNSARVDYRVHATAVLAGALWPIPGGSYNGTQAGSVLVAHGTSDAISPYNDGRQVFFAAHNPRAMLSIPGGSHIGPFINAGQQPDLVRSALVGYFGARLRADPAGAAQLFSAGNVGGLTQLESDGLQPNPFGSLDATALAGNQGVQVVGWAIDPDTDFPVGVRFHTDGWPVASARADTLRADVAAAFPSFSPYHGYDSVLTVGPGTHQVCAYAPNVSWGDADGFLGCKTVVVPQPQVFAGQVVSNADGRLEVLAVGGGGAVFVDAQVFPNGWWGGWAGLGGILVGRPRTAINTDGTVEVFGVGTDARLYHRVQACRGCPYLDWVPIGGALRPDSFAVAANADGRLEIVAVALDGTIVTSRQNGVSSPFFSAFTPVAVPWVVAPGSPARGLALGRQPNGRLALVAVDPTGHLRVTTQTAPAAGYGAWTDLGGSLTSPPTLGVQRDGALAAFAVGGDGRVRVAWQISPTAGWYGLADLGGAFDPTVSVAVVGNADQRLAYFGRAAAGGAVHVDWQRAPNSPWNGVVPLGNGAAAGALAAAPMPDGRIQLFGLDAVTRTTAQVAPNSAWGSWVPL